jgi:hypothetical protein
VKRKRSGGYKKLRVEMKLRWLGQGGGQGSGQGRWSGRRGGFWISGSKEAKTSGVNRKDTGDGDINLAMVKNNGLVSRMNRTGVVIGKEGTVPRDSTDIEGSCIMLVIAAAAMVGI